MPASRSKDHDRASWRIHTTLLLVSHSLELQLLFLLLVTEGLGHREPSAVPKLAGPHAKISLLSAPWKQRCLVKDTAVEIKNELHNEIRVI